MMSLGLGSFVKFVPGNIDMEVTNSTDTLRQICYQFLHDKRARQKLAGANATDILSKLMETNEFSDEELVDQLLTFIAAGLVILY